MLLTILKIILYIILILLLVILLLLALILLARLKYSVDGEYDKDDGRFLLFAKASWLFGIVKIEYSHGGENDGLRLILPFGLGTKKEEDYEPEPVDENDKSSNNETADNTEVLSGPELSKQEENKQEESKQEEIKQAESKQEESKQEAFDNKDDVSFQEEKPKAKARKEDNNINKKKPKPGHEKAKSKTKKESFVDKIKKTYNDFDKFKETYDIRLLIKNTFDCLIGLLKAIGIKKGSLSGVIGLSDPSQTGMVLGALSIANIYVPVEMDINGEFAGERLALKGCIIGKTYLLKLLWPLLVYVFRRPERSIIWDYFFKKEKKDKNNKKRNTKGRMK